jgi:hypothetical protein
MYIYTQTKIMNANQLTSSKYLSTIESIGLQVDGKTGGAHLKHFQNNTVFRSKPGQYKIFLEKGDYIFFMDPVLFSRTIKETEKSLKINLFDQQTKQ